MQLFWSPASPAARKVMASAIELGLQDRIMRTLSAPHPINRDQAVVAVNPLGQIPVLVAENGLIIHDSRVICEFLEGLAGGNLLFPALDRWLALRWQSLADGALTAAINARYEMTARPEEHRWLEWKRSQLLKVDAVLDEWEGAIASYPRPVDIGLISAGCTLGYLDFRYPDRPWRLERPALSTWFDGFSQRTSMKTTEPA